MTMRLVLSALLLSLAGAAQAQLISIKTVPVAQSDQFDIYPSHNLAMGGVSIALADPLLDPFVNPAKGARAVSRFYGAPLIYNVTGGAGAGRSLPLAAVVRHGSWFGTMSLALQQVDPSQQAINFLAAAPLIDVIGPVPEARPADRPHGNTYTYLAGGKTLSESGLSIAGSIRWAGLHGIDGVDLLYAGSSSIVQHGYAGDVRIGLLKEWAGDKSLEVLALHNRFRMAHDVTFLDFFWDPVAQRTRSRARAEQNLDYSDAWGLHVGYQRPVSTAGWRVGGIVTTNLMSHPKLPNYDVRTVGIVPIWGDPGNSWAFNVGVGASRALPSSTFAIDMVFEPIWTNTWGESTAELTAPDGRVIPFGGKTVENWFRFSNASINMGLDQRIVPRKGVAAVQLGIMLHQTSYYMFQKDYTQATSRNLTEGWVEWAPTWGLTFRFPEMEIRYRGRVTHGTGRPGVVPNSRFANRIGIADATQSVGSNILVAPSGFLTLGEVNVFNHQISVSVPIR